MNLQILAWQSSGKLIQVEIYPNGLNSDRRSCSSVYLHIFKFVLDYKILSLTYILSDYLWYFFLYNML